MRSRKAIETEIQTIKTQIDSLKTSQTKEIIDEKIKADETSSGLLSIVKLVVEENRKTTLILKSISDNLARLEMDLADTVLYGQDDQNAFNVEKNETSHQRVRPISGLDAKILQAVQIRNIACANDIKKELSYKGRNAASARLNRLYRQGLLERYQLGHTVYYKLDAGKTADTLIISPPQ
jgi:hypothetical protein